MLTEEKWEDLYRFRHNLHKHPELPMQEFETTARIDERLKTLGLEIITPTSMRTGVVAALGPKEAPVIVLRADIDCQYKKKQRFRIPQLLRESCMFVAMTFIPSVCLQRPKE